MPTSEPPASSPLWPADWPAYHNGCNTPCSIIDGPCGCGAWHKPGEFEMRDGTLYRHGRAVAGRLPSPGSQSRDRIDPPATPTRTVVIGQYTDALARPLEPGEAIEVRNESGKRIEWVAYRDDKISELARRLELKAEVERLRAEALRYYHADGTFEVLDSPEAVVRRRVEAAGEIERLKAACRKSFAACQDNLRMWQYKNEPALMEVFEACKEALGCDVNGDPRPDDRPDDRPLCGYKRTGDCKPELEVERLNGLYRRIEAECVAAEAETEMLHHLAVSDPDKTYGEVKAFEPGRTAFECRAIDVWNRASSLKASARKNGELRSEVDRLTAERDKLIDGHISDVSNEDGPEFWVWVPDGGESPKLETGDRNEAVAFVRGYYGLDTGAAGPATGTGEGEGK